MALADPVIVIPGITATYLEDRYPVSPETVWAVIHRDSDRAALHPQALLQLDGQGLADTAYEVRQPSVIRPGQLYEIAYRELIDELRYNLRDREDQPVPVYPFGYDWRQPLETSAAQLELFINEVIARTLLMRHYVQDGYGTTRPARVNLVGHSMGGLLATAYFLRVGPDHKVNKVATLATPYRGSFEAPAKLLMGTSNLDDQRPRSSERDSARVTPALYYLLPDAFPGRITAPPDIQTLFAPGSWQTSIVETISQQLQLFGTAKLNKTDLKNKADSIFAAMLDRAGAFRQRTSAFDLAAHGLSKDRWLVVAGVDAETRVGLKISKQAGKPQFEFNGEDRRNDWKKTDRWATGDGTVSLDGAVPAFTDRERVVCVRPDDFGYWEITDKLALKVAGFHGILPCMDMVHRLLVRFFRDLPDKRGNTWGQRLPGVAPNEWKPPLLGGLTDKTD